MTINVQYFAFFNHATKKWSKMFQNENRLVFVLEYETFNTHLYTSHIVCRCKCRKLAKILIGLKEQSVKVSAWYMSSLFCDLRPKSNCQTETNQAVWSTPKKGKSIKVKSKLSGFGLLNEQPCFLEKFTIR